jgi:hypothetical protein
MPQYSKPLSRATGAGNHFTKAGDGWLEVEPP